MLDVDQLLRQGFSRGLAGALARNASMYAARHWIIDNSGSMVIGDGHRITETPDHKILAQTVTRWEEIQETVLYHCQLAAVLNTPTVFRLLNDPGPDVGPQEFSVGQRRRRQQQQQQQGREGHQQQHHQDVEQDIRRVRTILQRAQPKGVTPLTEHIYEIRQVIEDMAPRLRRKGKRFALIIATDGLPTDAEGYGGEEVIQEFTRALQSLEGLPVWIVIRLCSDEHRVTNFYNNLDGKLELSLEVLDDFIGEAREVHRRNKWLNYALPMHRCRELGYHDRLFDLIDERALTKGELRDFCALLFGTNLERIPNPNSDWPEFLLYVKEQLRHEPQQWDPIRKKSAPWIDVKVLHRTYGKGKCTIM